MPVTLAQIVHRVEAAKPSSIEHTVREAIAALGHVINERTGDVSNPAEGCYRPAPARVIPRDQKFSTRRRH